MKPIAIGWAILQKGGGFLSTEFDDKLMQVYKTRQLAKADLYEAEKLYRVYAVPPGTKLKVEE